MASNLEPKINRIATAVTSALSALTAKGVTVPEGANVESLAALIESIQAGGGGGGKAYKIVSGYLSSTSTDTDGSFTLAHNLGCTPILFMMMRPATFSFNAGEIGCVLYGNPDADESLLPSFGKNSYLNKKIQSIVRTHGYVGVSINTGTVDNNSISFSQYKNGNYTAKVTGEYLWFAVGVEGA